MFLRNNVQLIGNLGSDPKVREISKNRKVANFSIATTDYVKTKSGFEPRTNWFNVVAWGRDAELVEKKCTKGTEVVIFGRLVNNVWEDSKGIKHYASEVHVNEIICRPRIAQAV